jgi:precorrin-6Y C5,15-methyltransferase (decarboxylating) CbiT subunit
MACPAVKATVAGSARIACELDANIPAKCAVSPSFRSRTSRTPRWSKVDLNLRDPHIYKWVGEGRITPHVSDTFPLAEYRRAMHAKLVGQVIGNCMLHPNLGPLIMKREVRMLSLASMRIRPDTWDIGAASGSISIEAAMLAPLGRVYAIEVDPEGVEICHENLRTHASDNMRVIAGRAPEALSDLETPDAVFGGGIDSMHEIVDVALERLRPDGRLVVNAITLENSGEVYGTLRKRGIVPEFTLLQISSAEPPARYLRFEALNPIQIFAAGKPASRGNSE